MNQPDVHICPLPLEPSLWFPIDSTPPGCHRALDWAPRTIQQLPTCYLFYTWFCIRLFFFILDLFIFNFTLLYNTVLVFIRFNATLSIRPTLFFPHWVHKSVLYVCVSIAALQIGPSVSFFYIPYVCVNIRYLFFSFWLISLV